MTEADVQALIQGDATMMRVLETVAALDLPDWWIAAGFIRCKVWDALHGSAEATAPGDIDVIFFDAERPASDDRELETALAARAPEFPWEVTNQAHIHGYNDDAPYRDSRDALSRWAETVSTVTMRLSPAGELELAAPHGIDDLVDMVIRPTPHVAAKRGVFERRLREKGWQARWPRVRVVRDRLPAQSSTT